MGILQMYITWDCRIPECYPLKKAIERSRGEDEGCIIYCGEGIGYCHTDHEEGAPLAYLLKVKNYREIEKNYDCTFGTEGIEEWMLHE